MKELGAVMTTEEVAKHYRVSRRTWERMVATGQAPRPLKIGKQNRWRVTDLQAWEDAGQPLNF